MTDNPHDDAHDEESYKSKSQVKREMLALQDLGKELTEMNDGQLGEIPVTGELLDAIHEFQRLRHNEARRRQMQYIGRLMREGDHQSIIDGVARLKDKHNQHIHRQHLVERWREQLMTGDKAQLEAFIAQYPNTDIQHLRSLLRQALKEKSGQKPPAHARKLFRYLLEVLAQDQS
ncbi:ribosome biogenesis factor YjgA [Marinimicrobium alkaliphilum]|uniref:ribosome biogenesis factor YjgA n=1 Tax=Marinimicrobium alkaliphilum TaxID=2202654 RepID=UPI000DB91BDD|nr:ribosome biogenesis factor YjgA [Marinimicrobium alkaliphilum]